MKKVFLLLSLMAITCCFLVMGVSAATTNEFGDAQTLANIDMNGMNTDTEARVVLRLSDGEYYTYPSAYIFRSGAQLQFDYSPISKALGQSITSANVIRLEVPSNIVNIAYGGISGYSQLLEIRFLQDSSLETVGGGGFYNNPLLEKINLPSSLKEFTGTQIFNACYALHTVTFAENSQLTKIPDYCFQNCRALKKLVLPHSVTTLGNNLFDSSTGIEELYLSPNLVDFGKNHFAWKQSGTLKIYAPAKLFANKDSVGISDFSWWENDKCLPSMVIFMTGTEEQAKAIVSKSTYHKLTNATVSAWDEGEGEDGYVPQTGWAIVYGYGYCDAFFGGTHQMTGEENVKIVDYFSPISIGDICTREGCGKGVVSKTIAPVFQQSLGISVTEKPDANGKYSMTVGYVINRDAYNELCEYVNLEFGFVVSAVSETGKEPLMIENGTACPVNAEKTIFIKQTALAYSFVDAKLRGLSSANNGMEFVMTMFVCDGENITYLNDTVTVNIPSAS